jgi:hypothetical protein
VRRGWDSNPRGTFIPAGFQDRCLQPLGHPSKPHLSITYSTPNTTCPEVFFAFNCLQSAGVASAVKARDIFLFFQANSTTDFQTFPLQCTTPSDAPSLQIVIGAARNSLPTSIVFDANNLR